MAKWLGPLQSNVETAYSDPSAGTRVSVDEMEFKGCHLKLVDASFRPPDSGRVDFEGLDASCEGKYKCD